VADNKENKWNALIDELDKLGLTTQITESLELITIYNAVDGSKNAVLGQNEVILKQHTGRTRHYLIKA
jgi:hypothetical protein